MKKLNVSFKIMWTVVFMFVLFIIIFNLKYTVKEWHQSGRSVNFVREIYVQNLAQNCAYMDKKCENIFFIKEFILANKYI